jgi:hypothetical protein
MYSSITSQFAKAGEFRVHRQLWVENISAPSGNLCPKVNENTIKTTLKSLQKKRGH